MSDADTLFIWTITHNPDDFPGKFVARKHAVMAGVCGPTRDFTVSDTLEEVRASLPPGLFNLGRQPGDLAVIVESWV